MDGIGNRGIIARIRARTPQGYCTDEDIVVASASGSRFTDADGKHIWILRREYLPTASAIVIRRL